jgi:hypothetical protein
MGFFCVRRSARGALRGWECLRYHWARGAQDDNKTAGGAPARAGRGPGQAGVSVNPLADELGSVSDANLYGFVGNNPVRHIDILGLALHAVDGTWSDAARRANPWWLVQDTKEEPRRYWRGPRIGSTGSDTLPLALNVASEICKDWCQAKQNCQRLKVNLTGWSRGAIAAAMVAKNLNDVGCRCGGWWVFGGTWCKPVKVNWVGLFDAVAMTGNQDSLWPRTVPPNVAHFDHAIKTAKQWMFPTWYFGGSNERAFNRYNGTPTSHSEIGESRKEGNNDSIAGLSRTRQRQGWHSRGTYEKSARFLSRVHPLRGLHQDARGGFCFFQSERS